MLRQSTQSIQTIWFAPSQKRDSCHTSPIFFFSNLCCVSNKTFRSFDIKSFALIKGVFFLRCQLLWKPRKRVTDLFSLVSLEPTKSHGTCTKWNTSRLAEVWKSLHRQNTKYAVQTESRLESKLTPFKHFSKLLNSGCLLTKTNKTKQTPGQHSLIPSPERTTPREPNFHTSSCSSAGNSSLSFRPTSQTSSN